MDLQGLLSNPAFMAGMGILGSEGNVGRGGLLGLQMAQQQRQQIAEAEKERYAMEQMQKKAQMEEMARQAYATNQPTNMQEMQNTLLEMAKHNPEYIKQFIDTGKVLKESGPLVSQTFGEKLPGNYRWKTPGDPSAGVEPIPGGPATEAKEHEASSATYAQRMMKSEERLNKLMYSVDANGNRVPKYDPTEIYEQLRGVTNITATPEMRSFRQSLRDWARAKLRKESGAVITEEEITNEISTYFPVLGDDENVIRQKEEARKIALDAMIEQSQGAWQRQFGEKKNGGRLTQKEAAKKRRVEELLKKWKRSE